MKQMINLCLKTEYSFKETFGKLNEVVDFSNKQNAIGIADINNTFGHVRFEALCQKNELKPIFGVRLMVVNNPEQKVRSRFGPEYIFIAKNNDGLREIYELTKTAYDKFYYKAQISIDDMIGVSDNVFVICECPETLDRIDYIGLSQKTPKMMLQFDIPKVAISQNRYPTPQDKQAYQLLAGARKSGNGWNFRFNDQTYPQHILTTEEWFRIWRDEEAINNTHKIADQCNVEIPKAKMVLFDSPISIEQLSRKGAIEKRININEEPYKSRFDRELGLIKDKEYSDYFLITADMVSKAKNKMLVGPARGSAAGSLICYLLGITTVDPLKHGLLFERFIDINRADLPDIDIDFPDTKRKVVIKDLINKFKAENVCHIANVNKLKAKSAIGECAMSLSIPKFESELIKDQIVDRAMGDARADFAASDTLRTTQAGKDFIEKYPSMILAEELEGHATHSSVHAAGIIICNENITKFGGVNSRDNVIMMDKKDAECKNLLKIDVLGLRTLSVLEECVDLINKPYSYYYDLPLDDKETFKIFNGMRLSGIFQFEGQAVLTLCSQMGVENFNDIVALTALARPGPLSSGAAATYIKRRIGNEITDYLCEHPSYIEATEETQGVIIFQEQLMMICRNCAGMDWEDVSEIRKGASKSLGKDFFQQYKNKFIKGAKDNGIRQTQAEEVWENMIAFGGYGMNKSHSVAYGYISYWCAYMKAHYPLEFAAANLNNAKSDESALKMLRDVVKNEGIEYIPVDADESLLNWSIKDGKLLGGLKNIHGIGEAKAKDILRKREQKIAPTTAIIKKLINPETEFDILNPCEHYFNDYYVNFRDYGLVNKPCSIFNIGQEDGEYVFLGKVISKDLNDLNEYNELVKRKGQILEKNNKILKLIIQDDSGEIMCKINRFKYDKLKGNLLNDTLIVDETFVLIKGTLKNGWRIIDITGIHNLGDPKNAN